MSDEIKDKTNNEANLDPVVTSAPVESSATVETAAPVVDSAPVEKKKGKFRRVWDYVTDYKRTTVAMTLPSVAFDICYSFFLLVMVIFSRSLWVFVMSVYYFLLCMLRVNVLYRAGRGAVFKSKRFTERRNYRTFSRNLILLDILLAYNVYLIAKNNVIHDYPGILVYAFGIYVLYKVLLAVINIFRAHKSKSLTALALRKIGIVDAMVSVLSLEWALSHRDEGNLSLMAIQIEKYIGIVVVVVIFLMGAVGAIRTIKMRIDEKKEGKAKDVV